MACRAWRTGTEVDEVGRTFALPAVSGGPAVLVQVQTKRSFEAQVRTWKNLGYQASENGVAQ